MQVNTAWRDTGIRTLIALIEGQFRTTVPLPLSSVADLLTTGLGKVLRDPPLSGHAYYTLVSEGR